MRILVAHHSASERGRLKSKLATYDGLDVVFTAGDLSQTYDFSEHHRPHRVVLSAQLADCAEFELLASLFQMMGIGCVVIGALNQSLSHKTTRYVRSLPDDANADALVASLRSLEGTRSVVKTKVQGSVEAQSFPTNRLILIGSSTGGVDALLTIIKHFPRNCPPTLIVQHTGGQFAQSLIRLLDGGTQANVQSASHGSDISPGNIYLAPDDAAHLQLAAGKHRRIAITDASPIMGHRPSVDALFRSAIHVAPDVTAAILTGMGRDGADAITALRKAGAHTIGQDEGTSVVYGMPRVAMELGGVERQLPIAKIGPALLHAAEARTSV